MWDKDLLRPDLPSVPMVLSPVLQELLKGEKVLSEQLKQLEFSVRSYTLELI